MTREEQAALVAWLRGTIDAHGATSVAFPLIVIRNTPASY